MVFQYVSGAEFHDKRIPVRQNMVIVGSIGNRLLYTGQKCNIHVERLVSFWNYVEPIPTAMSPPPQNVIFSAIPFWSGFTSDGID